jgi:hypothetical protein
MNPKLGGFVELIALKERDPPLNRYKFTNSWTEMPVTKYVICKQHWMKSSYLFLIKVPNTKIEYVMINQIIYKAKSKLIQ